MPTGARWRRSTARPSATSSRSPRTAATPLWRVLLDEHRRYAGNDDLARELEPAARAALDWIDLYGDLDGDGYVEYKRRNEDDGLENQCWKDSADSIRFRDGRFG